MEQNFIPHILYNAKIFTFFAFNYMSWSFTAEFTRFHPLVLNAKLYRWNKTMKNYRKPELINWCQSPARLFLRISTSTSLLWTFTSHPPPAHTYMPREFPQPHTTPPWLPLLVSPQLTRGVKNSQEKQSDSAVSFSTTLCMYLRKSAATLFLPACV